MASLAELMQLVDEYYQVELLDPSKLPLLQQQIWDLIREANLDEDLKQLAAAGSRRPRARVGRRRRPRKGRRSAWPTCKAAMFAHLIEDLDGYLCELAGAQIRDGLHILGQVPQGEQMVGLLACADARAEPGRSQPARGGGRAVRSDAGCCWSTLPAQRLDKRSGRTRAAGRSAAGHAAAMRWR